MKTVIYLSEEELLGRIVEAAANIRQQPGSFERTPQSMLRRWRLCIKIGGRNFEHLL
jgi:hypothetical protein